MIKKIDRRIISAIDRGVISGSAWPERSSEVILDKLDEVVNRLNEDVKQKKALAEWMVIVTEHIAKFVKRDERLDRAIKAAIETGKKG